MHHSSNHPFYNHAMIKNSTMPHIPLHNKNYSEIRENPMSQYNFVIDCYNSEINRIGSTYLDKMRESKLFNFLYMLLKSCCGNVVMALIFIFIPVMNYIFFVMLWVSLIIYEKAYRIYRINRDKVPDPFQNMIYAIDACKMINRRNQFFDIHPTELGGNLFSIDQMSALKSKEDRGRIRFMIYDNIFWNFYYNFPKVRISIILWLFVSSGLLALHVYFFIYYKNFYALSF